MAACCEPQGYEKVFDDREARRAAARYARSGLTTLPRRTLELYRDGVIGGSTLLEVGGGIGDFSAEMLGAGVDRAVCVDISTGYDAVAARLLADAGLTGRASRRTGDLVTHPDLAGPADVVALHSVVCCYPDARALVTAAADRTRRYLVLAFPRDTWWMRAAGGVLNVYPRLRGSDWRFRVHRPDDVARAATDAGLRLVRDERFAFDHHLVFAR
ncbi:MULTISPECIES: bifunctional 2-polyprenyl-6-hydroxyphenol methylase/3-demethylubiquinol 3-O-methyltransferase UbiG [unclassified Isoptericola]|uniref:class I SAM-dependent methyltransferase n=1 Tax=unclassified Isoptericola TaxID=2623355 RepID=UPI00271287BB|nr:MULTISPECIES: SAM-dependent methyltransferase [unclassified Isoptericola]MDO8145487.1 SAM-dependent methyltransferase [Isoptericola sp. 178]MDO8149128.1 SAM-dependent methyltransferase [Isoptericola sp. b515]MDO8150927.1 SAM-dependent methyltransferase [Isoptericola sp. b408]